ncbi:MAG: G-protein coupled receptor [Pseudomonadota bacterium]
MVLVGSAVHVMSCFVIFKLSLWEDRKYQQLFLLNFTSIFCGLAFIFFLTYRWFVEMELFMCLLGFQVFNLGGFWNSFSLVSLTLDCFIAVYCPLKFRSILTMRQFFAFNVSALIVGLIIFFLPIFLYGFQHEGYLSYICTFIAVFPPSYSIFLLIQSLILGFSLVFLNIAIVFGVIRALIKQKQLSPQARLCVKKMLKLVFRVVGVVAVNFVCSLFVTLIAVGIQIFPDSICFFLAMSSSIWNIGIYCLSDENYRKSFKKAFGR